jgi:hypothetical protein
VRGLPGEAQTQASAEARAPEMAVRPARGPTRSVAQMRAQVAQVPVREAAQVQEQV